MKTIFVVTVVDHSDFQRVADKKAFHTSAQAHFWGGFRSGECKAEDKEPIAYYDYTVDEVELEDEPKA